MASTVQVSATAVRPVMVRAQAQKAAPAPVRAFVNVAGLATVGLSVAGLAIAFSAHADVKVKLGADSGALVYDPSTISVAAGETITFVNNAGFPHNIVFDEDEVPAGVDAEAISKEDYLNAPGESYSVKLTAPGTYGFYCEPHKGAGMSGKITVQ